MSDKLTCNAPNPGTEMRCQREQGHAQECWSKYRAFYEHGVESTGQMWWNGPKVRRAEVLRSEAELQGETHGNA